MRSTVAERTNADYVGHVDSKSAGLVNLHVGLNPTGGPHNRPSRPCGGMTPGWLPG